MEPVTQSLPKRKYGIDVARGVCLVVMMMDHLPASILQRFSNINYEPFGFFTVASAFVFLSGIVSATTYGSVLRERGPGIAWRRSLRRAGELYLADVAIFILIWAGIRFHLLTAPFWKWEFSECFTNPGKALSLGLALIYRPGIFDILPMFVFFMLLLIPALLGIRSGRRWLVLGLSFLVWAWVQCDPPSNPTTLNPFAYQVYFVGGLVVGSLQDFRGKLFDRKVIRVARFALAAAVVLCLFRFGMGYLRKSDLDFFYWHRLVHLQNNGPLRVFNFAAFGLSAAFLWVRLSDWMKRTLPLRWLSCLGRHSLQVFIWSIFIAYWLSALMPPSAGRYRRLANLAIAVPSLSIPAALHEKLKRKKETLDISSHETHE